MQLTRITFDPQVMGGKPCIRGLRVTVGTIVGLVATGYSTAEICKPIHTWKKKTCDRRWPMSPGALKRLKRR